MLVRVGVSCRILSSIVSYSYVICSGSITSVGEERAKAKKNIPVSRPTLIFPSDPKVFIGIPKDEIQSNATHPICGHLVLVLPLSLSYFSSVLKKATGLNRPFFHYTLQANNASAVFLVKIRENIK